MNAFKDIMISNNCANPIPESLQEASRLFNDELNKVNQQKETNIPDTRECEPIDVINFENVNLSFGNKHIIKDFSLNIKDFKNEGQFIGFIGRSGCGKSTLLKLLTQIYKQDSGTIKIYGEKLSQKHHIPMVFQNYSSLPWYTVQDNVALPLIIKGIDKKTAREKASEKLALVGLSGRELDYPNKLSGGQQQRVAIARALNTDSKILILDEYSSGLDMYTKIELQDLLLKLFNDRTLDRTFFLVTHDISEAVYLCNRVFVLGTEGANIQKVVDIDFRCQRTQEIRQTDLFKDYQSQIIDAMQ